MESHSNFSGFRDFFSKQDNFIKKLSKHLEKIQCKIVKCQSQQAFLGRCISMNIVPKGFNLSLKFKSDNRKIINSLRKAEHVILDEHLKMLAKTLKELWRCEKNFQVGLASNLSSQDFRWLTDSLDRKMRIIFVKEELRLCKKFRGLAATLQTCGPSDRHLASYNPTFVSSNSSARSECDMPKEFVNLTSSEFTTEELELLNRGTSFSIRGNFNTLDTIARLNSYSKADESVHKLVECVEKRISTVESKQFQSTQCKELNLIKKLKKNRNIKLLKADKGGKLVIMDVDQYNQKIREKVNQKYTLLLSDPTNKLVAKLRLYLTKEVGWSNYQRDTYAPLHPNIPSIYGLPKLHKEDIPLRLIISKKGTCFSEISRFLAQKLVLVIDKPVSIVKNSADFLHRLRLHPILASSTMISLDVVDMYSNIETTEALEILKKKIEAIDDKLFRDTLMMSKSECLCLVSLVIKNNYFGFEGGIYQQEKGLAMGCSLSPILANLVMEELELKILQLFQDKIDMWNRFMDDTFVEWLADRNELDQFLCSINALHPSIKFTMEKEMNNSLSFLDVMVKKTGNLVNTGIYSKPTASDGIIPFVSFNPLSLKMSVARQKVRRIESHHSDPSEAQEAKAKFGQTLDSHGYPNRIIRKILYSQDKLGAKDTLVTTGEQQERKYLPLQFDDDLQFKIQKILCSPNCGIAWKQKTKTLDVYKNRGIPSKNQNLSNVIYVIPCDCGQIYIGETGRSFAVRIKEHKANVRLERNSSKLQLHLVNNPQHAIRWSDAFVLDFEKDSKIRKTKEGLLIEMNSDVCISDKTIEAHRNWNWVLHKHKVKRKYFGTDLYTI